MELGHGSCGSLESSGSLPFVSVAHRLSSEQAEASEREYVACREAVVRMLRREFPRLHAEVDELYQQAWIEFLELRATGTRIDNPRALLQKIAWRAARARLRRKKPDLVEPASSTLTTAPDLSPLPDEYAQVRLDADALRVVVESLDQRQAAAIKLRFDHGLNAKEIQRRLNVSPKRLEKIVTEAYAELAAQLHQGSDGESAWLRRQRSLLLACETGLASARQRRRAQRVIDAHPACRAMLAEMRATLNGAAALLPVPVLVTPERADAPIQSLLDRLADAWASARQLPYEIANRAAPITNTAEQVGGAGGATVGSGAAAKIVAMCIAAGGTAALCVDGVRRLEPDRAPRAAAAPNPIVEPAHRSSLAFAQSGGALAGRSATANRPITSVSSPNSKSPASAAPIGSTEFGPGAIGSAGAPTAPAAAPRDGGGEFAP